MSLLLFTPSRKVLLGCLFSLGLTGCAGDAQPPSPLDELRASAAPAPGTAVQTEAERAESYASVMRIAERTEEAGDRNMAIGLYQRAHEIDPAQGEPLRRLASYYKELGHHAQAEEAYRRLTMIEPDEPTHLVELGFLLLRDERIFQARTQFIRALRLEPAPRTYNAAGVTYDMRGQRREAQQYYREALALDPDHLPSMGNLGLSLALSGDHAEAIEILEDTASRPDAGDAHRHMLATAYGLSGNMLAASRVVGATFDEAALNRNLEIYGAVEE